MKELRSLVAQLGSRRMMLMGAVAAALLLTLAVLAVRGSHGPMGFLYTDLDPSAAAAISDKLKAQNVPFELSSDGRAILAPVDRLPDLRMSLASERLGGKIGYEVLDAEEPFGVSSSRAKINETRAIEGELAKSIQSLDHVSAARVHLVMPERELFSTQERKASAAVTLRTAGRLPSEAVQSIRYLVASSVPELAPASVSVIDQTGALLARAGEEGSGAGGDLDGQQQALETRLRGQIESLLEPIVGHGKVRAEVAATLDRDQKREEAERYDPDTQVVQRQVTVETNDQSNAVTAGAEGATVSAQLPDSQAPINGSGSETQRAAKAENSEDTTYQNSRTQTVSVTTPGKVERLSVAVMVDGGAKGMNAGQVQRLTRLVENAVGYDAGRGDSVVVENMAFAADGQDDGTGDGRTLGLTNGQWLDLGKWLIIGAALLGAAWLLRRQLRAVPEREVAILPPQPVNAAQPALADETAATPQLEGPEGEEPSELALLDQEIALAQVDGKIRLSALQRIGAAIAASPAESAAVVRQWMNA
jgi:flagellar M-ring protein FliF